MNFTRAEIPGDNLAVNVLLGNYPHGNAIPEDNTTAGWVLAAHFPCCMRYRCMIINSLGVRSHYFPHWDLRLELDRVTVVAHYCHLSVSRADALL